MRTSLVALRLAAPFAAVLAIGVATVDTPADAAPARGAAEVLIHEDNSYSGLALYQDGHKVAHAWTVSGPRLQNSITLRRTHTGSLERVAHTDWSSSGPGFRGQVCEIVPERSSR